MKILFVCRGNVGRSQMAEAMFKQLDCGVNQVSSAGTIVRNKEGESLDGQRLEDCKGAEPVIEVLKEIEVDTKDLVRTQLTKKMVEEADEIVVMAEAYSIPDYLSEATNTIYWDIEDPKGQSLEFTRNIREQIKELVDVFYKSIQ